MTAKRGPVAGNAFGLRPGPKRKVPAGSGRPTPGSAVEVFTSGQQSSALPAPDGLSPAATEVCDSLVVAIPGRNDVLDAPTLARFAELVAERAGWAAALEEHGFLLEEPIVTPRGDIAGTRMVVNPAAGELRRIDRALDVLSDRLGLSPAARGRLGLVVSQAEQALATSAALISKLEAM